MALIIQGKATCPICGQLIRSDDSLMATTAFIEDSSHPLWRFSDAAMHQSCFDSWEHHRDFINAFNSYYQLRFRGMWFMLENGQIQEHEPSQ